MINSLKWTHQMVNFAESIGFNTRYCLRKNITCEQLLQLGISLRWNGFERKMIYIITSRFGHLMYSVR